MRWSLKAQPVTPKDIIESEQYQLDRQATALKKAGDWGGAIAALQKRKAIMGLQWQDDKLAKYLQAAGRFDEAMTEIQWLLDNSHAWAVASFSHQPASTLLKQRATRRSQIHGAAALICKRAKRADLQAEHERLRDACWELKEKLTPVAEADMKQRMRAWNAASHVERQALIAKREASTARNRAMQACRLAGSDNF